MGMGIERGLHGWVGLPPIELENCSWNYEVYEIWGLDILILESMLFGIYAVYGAMSNSVSSRIESLSQKSRSLRLGFFHSIVASEIHRGRRLALVITSLAIILSSAEVQHYISPSNTSILETLTGISL
jgi:hypothetical protein